MACATREMIARVSLLLYFVVEELLVSELLVFVWVDVATDSTPSPAGAAVRSTIRSSRAISQTAAATGCGTCVLGTKLVNTGDIVVLVTRLRSGSGQRSRGHCSD